MFALVLAAALLAVPLWQMPPPTVNSFLDQLAGSAFGERVRSVAQAEKDTPYAGGPLGEGPSGKYDQDPLIDLTRVDCVTFIEQTVALAASASYQEAFTLLQQIRYRGALVDYEARNHFMIADWIANNPWCHDVSPDLGAETVALTRRISHKDFFVRVKAPDLGRDTPDRDVTIHYIPATEAARIQAKIPAPALAVFIGKVDWLFALHTGLLLRGPDGALSLYHASSKNGKVVAVPLPAFIAQSGDRYLGFTIYAIENPKGSWPKGD